MRRREEARKARGSTVDAGQAVGEAAENVDKQEKEGKGVKGKKKGKGRAKATGVEEDGKEQEVERLKTENEQLRRRVGELEGVLGEWESGARVRQKTSRRSGAGGRGKRREDGDETSSASEEEEEESDGGEYQVQSSPQSSSSESDDDDDDNDGGSTPRPLTSAGGPQDDFWASSSSSRNPSHSQDQYDPSNDLSITTAELDALASTRHDPLPPQLQLDLAGLDAEGLAGLLGVVREAARAQGVEI